MTSTTRRRRRTAARAVVAGTVAAALTGLTACASGDDAGERSSQSGDTGTVTLVTHDSFGASKGVLEAFEKESGMTVEQVAPGDAGTLVNQLVLTKDSPLGDVVFGVDNTFASRAIEAGVLEPYTSPALDPTAEQYTTGTYDVQGALTPIDVGDVCINVDTAWFGKHDVPQPATLEDLTKPEYADLTVVTNPATSSPGLAFLLATVGAFGTDGWLPYWERLRDNGVKVAESWEDAYYVDFSGAGEGGQRPIALSYATSPAFTVDEDGKRSSTAALLDTCFRQVEYAGVLTGTDNPEGARALVDFLASADFQADIPGQMYMYPADSTVELPAEWKKFAPLATEPFQVSSDDVAAHRDEWIEQWTATVIG